MGMSRATWRVVHGLGAGWRTLLYMKLVWLNMTPASFLV